jgi:hypothetical protein
LAARRFLYVIAGLIMLTLAAAIGWNLLQRPIMRVAFVPGVSFLASPLAPPPDYTKPGAWLSRPDLGDDPSRWAPRGFRRSGDPQVAVFYLSPTTYLKRDQWNAPLDDLEANQRLRLFAASQASAFNGMGAVWAPRYRQATMGAFMTDKPDAALAFDLAYGDVERAFDTFLELIPSSRPILLAGHSQGSLHLMRLLQRRIAGKPIARRIVAAYLVGWPVSMEADLPSLGLPACTAPGEAGCILSWQSFAEPAEPAIIREVFDGSSGLNGKPRAGSRMLCVNPITGTQRTAALRSANLGSLIPRVSMADGDVVPGRVPARCDPSGFLLIGDPPAGYDSYVLPGLNYHVFDYALFWANIRADAEARARTYMESR